MLVITTDMPLVRASSSAALAMEAKSGSVMSGTATPMTGARPVRKVVAMVLGT
jgi:hypothetical protein